jgi:23S rRNA (cytosine1962-C5)-methyltransferase
MPKEPFVPDLAAPRLVLKSGRDRSLRLRHPWIFSGAVGRVDAQATAGGLVDVTAHDGTFLARAYYNPQSRIPARVLSFDPAEAVDAAFFVRRVQAAAARRRALAASSDTDCYRLVMSESDGLPGLIVDRYGDVLVVQALTLGIAARLPLVTAALATLGAWRAIVERSDDAVRELEGLAPQSGVLDGSLAAGATAVVREHGLAYEVDLLGGHKTGFYLDQRPSRLAARAFAPGARVLDCCSYTGGFSMNAAAAGARSVLAIDQSAPALERLAANAARNGFADVVASRQGNAFELLRELRDARESFDLIVLDPPKFAPHAAQVDKAARGYKDLNLLALKLLAPGGHLLTFSCSGHVGPELFQKIVFGAALDAGRDAQIVAHLFQGDDHPVLLSFPESLYLKGLALRSTER